MGTKLVVVINTILFNSSRSNSDGDAFKSVLVGSAHGPHLFALTVVTVSCCLYWLAGYAGFPGIPVAISRVAYAYSHAPRKQISGNWTVLYL